MTNRLRKNVGLYFAFGVLLSGVALSQPPSADTPKTPADSTQAPPVTGLVPDHAALSVENIEVEAEWYERVLGFKVFSKSDNNPTMRNWHLVIPGYRIDLVKYKGSTRPPRPDPIYMQQGWVHVVFHVDDVATTLKQLEALHIKVDTTFQKGVPIQLHIEDPEGNAVEIRRNLVV